MRLREIEKEIERPDGVIGPHTDPVRDGTILPHLLRQFLLDDEGLVRRLQKLQFTESEKPRWIEPE